MVTLVAILQRMSIASIVSFLFALGGGIAGVSLAFGVILLLGIGFGNRDSCWDKF
ncbi:MAG: hypothetical protein ACRCV0_04275 [Brevinema sp.]